MTTSDVAAAPPGWPVYDIRFADAVKRGFRQYVHFDGRASRAEFWYWYLFVVGGALILVLPSVAIGTATSSDGSLSPIGAVGLVVAGLFYAAILLPTIAIACRRLHDAGFSAAFLLLVLVTGLIPLIMCMLPTSPNAPRFGPPGQPGYPGALPYGYVPGYAPQPYGGPPIPVAPPGYQGPPPGYAAPPPGYQAPPPGYSAPAPGPTGYGPGPSGFSSQPEPGQPRPAAEQPRQD